MKNSTQTSQLLCNKNTRILHYTDQSVTNYVINNREST